MRIIDKNTDFYDYFQNIYRDDSIAFDRTDSFILTKEALCKYFVRSRWYLKDNDDRVLMLQVCNTFWLFLVKPLWIETQYGDYAKDYTIELLDTWKDYTKRRELIKLDFISFGLEMYIHTLNRNRQLKNNNDSLVERVQDMRAAIDTNDFRVDASVNKHIFYTNYKNQIKSTEKHIPILKACGIAGLVDPLTIYLSLEEYFSLEKQAQERTESVGITDKEKIENHGFDAKTSFRGA